MDGRDGPKEARAMAMFALGLMGFIFAIEGIGRRGDSEGVLVASAIALAVASLVVNGYVAVAAWWPRTATRMAAGRLANWGRIYTVLGVALAALLVMQKSLGDAGDALRALAIGLPVVLVLTAVVSGWRQKPRQRKRNSGL